MLRSLLKTKRDWLVIATFFFLINIFFLLLVRSLLKGGLGTIYKNWDTPSYVMAAISLYDPQIASYNNIISSPWVTPTWTFLPAHFPLYPILIRVFSFIGYFRAAILLSLGFTLAAIFAFYELVKKHNLAKNPLLLTLPFILLSPRWFALYHVGSTEPLFMFFLIMSLSSFLSRRHLPAAVWASLALFTRSQGALLGLAYLTVSLGDLYRTKNLINYLKTYYPYLLMPITFIGICAFYYLRTGDFFAFFNSIRAFGHYTGGIFPTFNYPAPNIETFWQEVNVYDYVLMAVAGLLLIRRKLYVLATVACVFAFPLIFIGHSDISRYAIPLIPFVLIAFRDIVERPEFVLGTYLMSPAIMLYTINFMAFNHGA